MLGRLGDILVSRGLITDAQLQKALASQGNERGMLGDILVRRGLLDTKQLGAALSDQFEVPYREIASEAVNPQIVRLLPESFARERSVLPICVGQGELTLAMVAPDDIETISESELITGYRVQPVVALHMDIHSALDRSFDEQLVARQTIVDMKMADLVTSAAHAGGDGDAPQAQDDESAPVVRLVKAILLGAINANASDIHLEPHTPEMRVRYRVDGDLKPVMTIPTHIEEAVVARIKVMADMNTTETRRPQDGKLTFVDGETKASLRVSTIPTTSGEKVVLRIIDDGQRTYSLENIGLTTAGRALIQNLLDRPHGMIVVTGPTGSGKSTTLYAMLSSLNAGPYNIVTVEDPVEAHIPGVNQVHADAEHGLGFANSLRHFMRQDPDVIMVGEIRDHETAVIAVQAALTGHLLLSTLHTNDAVGAVIRLQDLGIDSFKIGGALLGSVAQRLVRSICPHCKEPYDPNPTMLKALASQRTIPADVAFFRGRGCKKCLGTGYAGRTAIYEIMVVSRMLAEAIERGLPQASLREIALREGMIELVHGGLDLVFAGQTTVEEVYYKLTG
jgi:type IV pilus assembly protein PilB